MRDLVFLKKLYKSVGVDFTQGEKESNTDYADRMLNLGGGIFFAETITPTNVGSLICYSDNLGSRSHDEVALISKEYLPLLKEKFKNIPSFTLYGYLEDDYFEKWYTPYTEKDELFCLQNNLSNSFYRQYLKDFPSFLFKITDVTSKEIHNVLNDVLDDISSSESSGFFAPKNILCFIVLLSYLLDDKNVYLPNLNFIFGNEKKEIKNCLTNVQQVQDIIFNALDVSKLVKILNSYSFSIYYKFDNCKNFFNRWAEGILNKFLSHYNKDKYTFLSILDCPMNSLFAKNIFLSDVTFENLNKIINILYKGNYEKREILNDSVNYFIDSLKDEKPNKIYLSLLNQVHFNLACFYLYETMYPHNKNIQSEEKFKELGKDIFNDICLKYLYNIEKAKEDKINIRLLIKSLINTQYYFTDDDIKQVLSFFESVKEDLDKIEFCFLIKEINNY